MQSVDWATGVATLTAPHGLAAKTAVILVPNSYSMEGMMSFPIELMNTSSELYLTPVDSNTVKITNTTDGVIAVNTASVDNATNLDITKFHFEKLSPITITNLPLPKVIRYRITGFVRNKMAYRYTLLKYKSSDGSIYNTTQQFNSGSGYLQILGFPSIPNSNNYNGVWGMQNWILNYLSPTLEITADSTFIGRRAGISTHNADSVRETLKCVYYPVQAGRDVMGIFELSTYNPGYSYIANGTVIEIYDLGGS